jgi:hypothetical protein
MSYSLRGCQPCPDDKLFWHRVALTITFPFVIAYVIFGGLFIYGRYMFCDVIDEFRTLRRIWLERSPHR